MWHLLAVWRGERSEKYLEENVDISGGASCTNRNLEITAGEKLLHTNDGTAAVLLLIHFLFRIFSNLLICLFIYLVETDHKQTNSKAIPHPPPQKTSGWAHSWSFLGWMWPEVHLSAAHWEGKKSAQKKNSSSVFTLKLHWLPLCS